MLSHDFLFGFGATVRAEGVLGRAQVGVSSDETVASAVCGAAAAFGGCRFGVAYEN